MTIQQIGCREEALEYHTHTRRFGLFKHKLGMDYNRGRYTNACVHIQYEYYSYQIKVILIESKYSLQSHQIRIQNL